MDASADAVGQELVQSDDHGGWVDRWTRCAADCSCGEGVACKCSETWVVKLGSKTGLTSRKE